MTARNKTATFQNLRTVSDIINSVPWQQQRGTGLSIADPLVNTRGEVHKDSIFHCTGERPDRGHKGVGVVFNLSTSKVLKPFLF